MNLEILMTKDGSHTLKNTFLNETYHSTHGAEQESQFVFIENGLKFAGKKTLKILELGFGTGLNALLTLKFAIKNQQRINYLTIEKFPIKKEWIEKLNYTEKMNDLTEQFQMIHSCHWEEKITIHPLFDLTKINADFYDIFIENNSIDIIYFDAFGAKIQPELWQKELFEILTKCIKTNGIFITYSAKGSLKRDLKSLGWQVESLPGPPGKREIVRAVFMGI